MENNGRTITPSYRLINPQANRSFVLKYEPFDLTTRWHYHPEVELIYFIEGATSGVIGDRFHPFSEGDLVLLGTNLPHVLQEHADFARLHPEAKPFGLIIQFTQDFLGTDFFFRPELRIIRNLLQASQRGLMFHKGTVAQIAPLLAQLPGQSETRKLLCLLEVLTLLAEAGGYRFLTAEHYTYHPSQDETRMQAINQYVYAHFKEDITLEQIARVANMTDTSFCRYFKSRTLKTFTRFLAEVRIAYACRLLHGPDASVTNVCFASGFNSLSYFNRQFKAIMKMSPQVYRQRKGKAIPN